MSAARLVWKSNEYRIVKRDTVRWNEGVFDVEKREKDALGGESWRQVDCLSFKGRSEQPEWVADVLAFLESQS